MNLWIASRATHWTDTEIVHVYCVMDGVFIVSDWDTKAEAEKALDEITEIARFVARKERVMLPDEDDDFVGSHETVAFAFTVALAGLIITAILAWVGA